MLQVNCKQLEAHVWHPTLHVPCPDLVNSNILLGLGPIVVHQLVFIKVLLLALRSLALLMGFFRLICLMTTSIGMIMLLINSSRKSQRLESGYINRCTWEWRDFPKLFVGCLNQKDVKHQEFSRPTSTWWSELQTAPSFSHKSDMLQFLILTLPVCHL